MFPLLSRAQSFTLKHLWGDAMCAARLLTLFATYFRDES